MKQRLLLLLAFAAGMATTTIIGWRTTDKEKVNNTMHHTVVANPDSHPVLALRRVKVKAGVSTESFERWATKLPANAYGKIPGTRFYVAKGERGDETGTYLFINEYDSKQTRDFYYPVAGADSTKISAEARRLLRPWDAIATDFGKVAEVVATGKESYTDYIILQ